MGLMTERIRMKIKIGVLIDYPEICLIFFEEFSSLKFLISHFLINLRIKFHKILIFNLFIECLFFSPDV